MVSVVMIWRLLLSMTSENTRQSSVFPLFVHSTRQSLPVAGTLDCCCAKAGTAARHAVNDSPAKVSVEVVRSGIHCPLGLALALSAPAYCGFVAEGHAAGN